MMVCGDYNAMKFSLSAPFGVMLFRFECTLTSPMDPVKIHFLIQGDSRFCTLKYLPDDANADGPWLRF